MHQASQLADESLDVLVYGLNYAPEIIGAGRYTSEIAQYLSSNGHSVLVVTAPPHYPGWTVERPYFALRYTFEEQNRISVTRCPIFVRTKIHGIWRLLAPLSFAISSAPIVLWAILRHKPHVVFCIEPTLLAAPVALIAAKYVGSRTVLHVHDLEVDAAFAVGHLKSGIMQRIAHYFEHWILRGFDQIISISTKMSERLVSKGVNVQRIALIRNWTDLDRIRPLYNNRNPIRSALGISEDTFVVLYSGSIGAKQGLQILLDVAAQFAKEKRSIAFVVVGEGPEKPRLIERYGRLPNVWFLPLQPEDRLCELLNLADLHALLQSRRVADYVLPSKLGGLLGSGKPILVTTDPGTELYELLQGTAIIVAPGDTAAIAKEILGIAGQGPRPALGEVRKLAELFSKSDCLKRLILVLTAVAGVSETSRK